MRIGFVSRGAALALLAAAGGAACKKAPPPPPPVAVEPAPAPAPLAVKSVQLGKAVGADKRVTTPTTTFGVRDTIYAAVSTDGVAASATLAARWSFTKTGQLVDSTAVSIAPTGPAVTEFHIIRPKAWPAGKYRVAVLLNGVSAAEQDFEVK